MTYKDIISYLWPFTLKKYHSKISGEISIHLINGKRTVDTTKSNYSFGTLQKILKKALLAIAFDATTKSILILGLGAGSIVETIRKDFHSDAEMTVVEVDPTMVQIAENEFLIREYKHIHIVTCDAYEYVKTCSQQFDLIIVDIFIIDTIPEVFTQEAFLHQIAALVLEQGQLIYNTMRSTMTDEGFLTIQKSLAAANMQVNTLEKVAWTNDLILAKKNKSSS